MLIYHGDTNGHWSTGSGEFPQPSCIISLQSSLFASTLVSLGKVGQMPDAIRIMARAGHITKYVLPPNKPTYQVDAASIEVRGAVPLPPSGKTVNLSNMSKPKPDNAHYSDTVKFISTMTTSGFTGSQQSSQAASTPIEITLAAANCSGGQVKPCTADGSCAVIGVHVGTHWNSAYASDGNAPKPGESWDEAQSNYSDKDVMTWQQP